MISALCASLAPATPSTGAPGSSSATVQPVNGGTLRFGRSDDLVTTNGMFFQSTSLGTTYGMLYKRLIDYHVQLNARPCWPELVILA